MNHFDDILNKALIKLLNIKTHLNGDEFFMILSVAFSEDEEVIHQTISNTLTGNLFS
jgi:hypothetical protein